jgi:hypothetical protein
MPCSDAGESAHQIYRQIAPEIACADAGESAQNTAKFSPEIACSEAGESARQNTARLPQNRCSDVGESAINVAKGTQNAANGTQNVSACPYSMMASLVTAVVDGRPSQYCRRIAEVGQCKLNAVHPCIA